jgi:hypothetical protein
MGSIGSLNEENTSLIPATRPSGRYSNLTIPSSTTSSLRWSRPVVSTSRRIVENLVHQIEDRLKQKKPRIERSRLEAAAVRAAAKAGKIEDENDRKRSLLRLAKVQKKLCALTPRRGPATVAVSEVASLIAKFVRSREQREKLVAAIGKLVG